MRKLTVLGLVLVFGLCNLWGATLSWQAVTTDITGAPTPGPITYKAWQRKASTTEPWVKFAETANLSVPIPTPSARMEYAVSAVDLAGNESDLSAPASAKPESPKSVQVIR